MPLARTITITTGAIALAATMGLAAPVRPTPPVQGVQMGAAAGQTVNGISCDSQEGSRIHIHQHLVILDHGKPVSIPATVGQPAGRRCIYWLHTHTPDGVVHIEAPQDRTFTLGDFFSVWGQPLNRTTAASARAAKGASLKVWVNDKPYKGDPRAIPMTAHADIVIEAGPPFPKPPKFTAWGTL
jgi:hypothetical protein